MENHSAVTHLSENSSRSAMSGTGMDRKVERPKSTLKFSLIIVFVAAIAGVLFVVYTGELSKGHRFQIDLNRIEISTVTKGMFEDFIPVRGRVAPLKTVFLDAIEGGRIESVPVEDGALLKQGELIVVLSNSNLQLSVNRNEALVTEQLNNMRSIELQLEQNRLAHKRTLLDIDFDIKRLTRQVQRERQLIENKSIPQSQLDQTEDELEYALKRKALSLKSQATDARLQESQLKSLQAASIQLKQNLAYAKTNLDKLNIRAPVSGKLSGFNVEVGQSISPGGRLGQVDDPSHYKVTAMIDEFYLGRVDLEQFSTFDRKGKNYTLRSAKIYPQVVNGQFEVDFVFVGPQPDDIRRGQSLQTQLTLGDASEATVIPSGAFYQDTGGHWVFVVSPEGDQAIKRTVRLGRRNAKLIEVLEGLEPGEQVITSPYTSFIDRERLQLKSELH